MNLAHVSDLDVPRKRVCTLGSNAEAHATADALGILREWSKVLTLTATACACCGKDLRDAVSVTSGIGPECSRQHYNLPFDITDDMVMEAMGAVAASKLDSRIKVAIRGLQTKPRDLCNVLVWWSSVNLNNVDVVLQCAEIVSLLGFATLGDRLRERNTNLIVIKDGEHFIVRCLSRPRTISYMKRVKEAVIVPREGRFKYGWRFPATRKELVWAILGEDFGGQWATVPRKDGGPSHVIRVDTMTAWDVRRAFEAAYNPKPVAAPVVVFTPPPAVAPVGIVRVVPGGIEIHTPSRNWGFVSELKLLPNKDRRWDGDGCFWRVAPQHEAKVRALVVLHFNGAV